jgi:hypothetical protein
MARPPAGAETGEAAHGLDERAAKDPASVTEEEIEWAREYLGLPMLELPKPP